MLAIKDIDRVERYIKRELKKFKKSHVEVGIRDNELAEDGSSILLYATANEFGTKYIPERSFIRSTVDEKKAQWAYLVEDAVDDIFDLRAASAKIALGRIGVIATGDIKDKISSNIGPENAPSTKKKKGGAAFLFFYSIKSFYSSIFKKNIMHSESARTVTLIDTGAMRNAVNYKIVGI